MKIVWIVAFLFCFCLLCCCGCGEKAQQQPQENSCLRLNIRGEPATLDPRKGGDLVSASLHFLLFEGLTRLTADFNAVPAQAESIDVSRDGKIYTFHLKETRWSDGTSVTAYDFEATWKDVLDPAFPSVNAYLLYPIANAQAAKKGLLPLSAVGIRAKDAKTLVVELETPLPYFLKLTASPALFPVNHRVDRAFEDWAGQGGLHFVCNGPFRLVRWRHNNEISLEKNPYYWQKNEIAFETVRITMIDNEMTALNLYQNGQLDLLGLPFSPLPADAIADLSKQGELRTQPAGASTLCIFNTTRLPFCNANIRKAFAYAIHREEIVRNITQGSEQVALGVVPSLLRQGRIIPFFKDGDDEKARECLAKGLQELGISRNDLPPITYIYGGGETSHKIVQALQEQWFKTLGILVNLEKNERNILQSRLIARDFCMAQTVWVAQYDDPMSVLERLKCKHDCKNYTSWENAAYVKLLEQSAFDKTLEQRLERLEEAEALLLEEMPVCPLFHWNYVFIAKPHLKQFHLSSLSQYN